MATENKPRNTSQKPQSMPTSRSAGDIAQPRQADGFVQSFARGLSVIRAFGRDHRTLTLSEVAAQTALTRAGARRILLTLQALGYVNSEGRSFYLTPKILDLGYSYISATPLWDLAEPFMEEVVNEVHESCSASVLDGTDIVYILRVPTKKIMSITLSIGSRLPAWCTSMGRILLGDLPEAQLDALLERCDMLAHTAHTVTDRDELRRIIREDHQKAWSLVNQELEDGLISISVPLRDRSGRVIAAMNVSAQTSRISPTDMTRNFLPVLKRAAEKINASLMMRPG